MAFDIENIRKQFPILDQKVYGKPLVYFDSAASTQKCLAAQISEQKMAAGYYGNIHRAAHYMADKTTAAFEAVRDRVKNFIHASHRGEIIFTGGATESINLAAFSFGEAFVGPGDEIIVSEMEHHSNIVPWQMMALRKGAKIIPWSFLDNGESDIAQLQKLITSRTKLIAVCHVSNVLGTINPLKEIISVAHDRGVRVLVDGAQAIQHMKVDVQDSDTDFYVFSSHKMYGPNGVGVLYGKKELLEQMPPWQTGGEMVAQVSFRGTTFGEIPLKFEAGTPNITGVIAFGEAVEFLTRTGFPEISSWEHQLLENASHQLREMGDITIYGNSMHKSGVISFNIKGIHPYDAGVLLDKMGIAVRTGHHCADTVMEHFNIPGTVRISFGIYNTPEEIDLFMAALRKVKLLLQGK